MIVTPNLYKLVISMVLVKATEGEILPRTSPPVFYERGGI